MNVILSFPATTFNYSEESFAQEVNMGLQVLKNPLLCQVLIGKKGEKQISFVAAPLGNLNATLLFKKLLTTLTEELRHLDSKPQDQEPEHKTVFVKNQS